MESLILIGILLLILLSLVANDQSFDEALVSNEETDEAFLAQMPEDVSPDTAIKVRRILGYLSGLEQNEIWPSTSMEEICE